MRENLDRLMRPRFMVLLLWLLSGGRPALASDVDLTLRLVDGITGLPLDGRDRAGRELASGTYFYRVRTGGVVQTGRMSLVR